MFNHSKNKNFLKLLRIIPFSLPKVYKPKQKTFLFIWALCLFLSLMPPALAQPPSLPQGFVYLDQIIPEITLDLRYASGNNFIGQTVDGYLNRKGILSQKGALALQKVQEDLRPFGLGLKIYDAYRPQRAVNHFIRWAKDLQDTKTKKAYYPMVKKEDLFRLGYIADRSSHSRGSTVDLTIISLGDKKEIDMGTGYDWFGQESWPDNPTVSPEQRAHRLLLQTLMTKHGFAPYPQEWWHFTLKEEPFPETYFDFPVQ
jgi:D-alanyl-D-alanine dipeptidase